jgi:glycerol uptake facilitator-like aquaporin
VTEQAQGRDFFLRGGARREAARLAAELIGAFIVTLGTIVPEVLTRHFGVHLGYGVRTACTGIATMSVVYALGTISGAHNNPMVTLAFALRGDFPWSRVPGYLVAQLLGAIGAGALVVALFHPPSEVLLTRLRFGPWAAFWFEIVLTAILVLVTLATANKARILGAQSAVATGATTVFARWIAFPISGGSMNPARTLGPAIVAGGTSTWWVFVFAPTIGMLIAVALTRLIVGETNPDEAQKADGEG